jgi:hypothetical protein
MTTAKKIKKLRAEIADVEREIERLKSLPKIDVYKFCAQRLPVACVVSHHHPRRPAMLTFAARILTLLT